MTMDLPASLARTPALDRWVSIDDGGTVTVRTGKVEIGQGILTALQLIAAEELDVAPERVRVQSGHTGTTPNELITAGSMSIEQSGAALRQACATARLVMLQTAADQLGTQLDNLSVDDGVITGLGLNVSTDYWAVQAGKPFNLDVKVATGEKPPRDYQYVGKGRHTRVDLPAKLRGEASFVHDLVFDPMLHARIVRPPSYHHRLAELDVSVEEPAHLLVDGSFVAVMHPVEYRAVRLAERITAAARWLSVGAFDTSLEPRDRLHRFATSAHPLRGGVPADAAPREFENTEGLQRVSAVYSRPYLMHGSIGPSAAAAMWREQRLTLWSSSQGVELLCYTLAPVLGMEPDQITVIHTQGAGCYGHNGADDVCLDAALCAMAVPGVPVLVKWTRTQEHQWEPYGSAMRVALTAGVDQSGAVRQWSHDVWSHTHVGRPIPGQSGSQFIAAWHRAAPVAKPPATPRLAAEVGIHRNALPIYTFPDQEVVKRFVADAPLRTSSLRGLGAQANVFAIESFMDELAHLNETDPIGFRLNHLVDERARAVLDAVVELAGGLEGPRGVGLARYKNQQCYAAVIAEVVVDHDTAVVAVKTLWIAADAGRVIDRDGIINQLEGGAVQATSWCLKEAVRFSREGIDSVDWESYPILRFSEVPSVYTVLIDRPDSPAMGAGEATVGPTSGAIANAVFAATGLRVRDLPISPERLRDVAAASQ
jgi:CO/xanthine dehydrogenase Mo-binding subunit